MENPLCKKNFKLLYDSVRRRQLVEGFSFFYREEERMGKGCAERRGRGGGERSRSGLPACTGAARAGCARGLLWPARRLYANL